MDDMLTSLNWLTNPTTLVNPPTPPTTPDIVFNEPLAKHCIPVQQDFNYKHNDAKPPFSYAQLITLAMTAHNGRKVLLTEIYDWIKQNFAYFRGPDTSWQNSIRHNLSLNKQFIKIPRGPNDKGKGSYWLLDPENSFSKDPYCIRRRSFPPENKIQKPKPTVSHPCINPAVKAFLESEGKDLTAAALQQKLQQKKPKPLASTKKGKLSETKGKNGSENSTPNSKDAPCVAIDEFGAQECVYTNHIPSFEDFNQKLFKKEIERFIMDPEGYNPQGDNDIERVKVEYNWEGYIDYQHGNWTGVQLPLQSESFGSVGLSPTTSDESERSRIPTPDWWRQSGLDTVTTNYNSSSILPDSQFSPNSNFNTVFPLARMFVDPLTSPVSDPPSIITQSGPHPWSEQPPPGIFAEPTETADNGLLDLDYGRTIICDPHAL